MKKKSKHFMAFLLAVFMLMMCSCGSKADDSEEEKDPNEKYYGTWILVAFEKDGKMYTKDDPGDLDVELFSCGYKLEKNGKAIYITPTKSEGEYDVEPWTVDGDTILIGINKFEFKDNQLVCIFEYNDNKAYYYYYEKEDQTESKIPNEENTDSSKSKSNKEDLKSANSSAKLVFTTVEATAADILFDGGQPSDIHSLDYPTKLSELNNSDTIEKAVYDALRQFDIDSDCYVYWETDSTYSVTFAQFGEESVGIIGQYPDPATDPEDENYMGSKF